ncbi:MAG TPA: DNA methyltransferase, partial [Candidatus Thermoplasmatota archaeon]|nr:DNA methyltransferase [Candidatus Thermoplasmatota archaeon]
MVVDARALLARLPTKSVGLIITDPPWDIHDGPKFNAATPYERLGVEEIVGIFDEARRVLVSGGHLYVFATVGKEILDVLRAFEAHGWTFLRLLAWDKGANKGLGAYRNAWEPVLIFSNGRPRRYQKRVTYSSLLRARSIGRRTAKPWELYEVFVEMSSRPGELVVDPFCGTNPLQKACERIQPPRRWLAGDLLPPEVIAEQLAARPREQAPAPPEPNEA